MIFVLGHPSNTYTLHGLQSRKNGVEICNAKPLPIPIYIHNYFFFLTYYEEWDNPQSRVCWTLPMYFPVQFVESIIQYYYCRYICGDDSSELLGDYSRHYPLLPTWLFITSIIIQIVLLIWGVSKILCYYSSYCIGRKTILGKREHGEITKDDELQKRGFITSSANEGLCLSRFRRQSHSSPYGNHQFPISACGCIMCSLNYLNYMFFNTWQVILKDFYSQKFQEYERWFQASAA